MLALWQRSVPARPESRLRAAVPQDYRSRWQLCRAVAAHHLISRNTGLFRLFGECFHHIGDVAQFGRIGIVAFFGFRFDRTPVLRQGLAWKNRNAPPHLRPPVRSHASLRRDFPWPRRISSLEIHARDCAAGATGALSDPDPLIAVESGGRRNGLRRFHDGRHGAAGITGSTGSVRGGSSIAIGADYALRSERPLFWNAIDLVAVLLEEIRNV